MKDIKRIILHNKILIAIGSLVFLYFLWGIIIGIYPKARFASGMISIRNEVETQYIGFGGGRISMQYRYFEILKTSSDKQLIRLLDSRSEAVQCYAFKALADKNYPDLFDLVVTRLNYTNSVSYQFLDMIMGEQVSDYFIYNGDFSDSQQAIIDSILIFEDIDIESKKRALLYIEPKENFYNKIRELALNNEVTAFIALAKYKNNNDIELIKTALQNEESLYYGLWAIREFPDTAFFSDVLNIYEDFMQNSNEYGNYSEKRILFQCLVQFDSKILDSLFKDLLIKNNTKILIENPIDEEARQYELAQDLYTFKTEDDTIINTVMDKQESEYVSTSKYEQSIDFLWLALEKYETIYDYLQDSIKIGSGYHKNDLLMQIDCE